MNLKQIHKKLHDLVGTENVLDFTSGMLVGAILVALWKPLVVLTVGYYIYCEVVER